MASQESTEIFEIALNGRTLEAAQIKKESEMCIDPQSIAQTTYNAVQYAIEYITRLHDFLYVWHIAVMRDGEQYELLSVEKGMRA